MTTKFSKILSSGCVICHSGFFWTGETTKEMTLPIYLKACTPAFSVKINSLKWRGSSILFASILAILGMSAFANILPPIIEGVVVSVVCLLFIVAAKNQTGHFPATLFGSVKTFGSLIPMCLPLPLRQPSEVGGIDNGILTLRETNQAVRWIGWLGDLVSRYAESRHESSEKGFVLPSHYIRCLIPSLLPLLLLCPLVFAQVKVAGPSKIAGPQKVVPGGGVDNQIGPLDFLAPMFSSGPGTTLTAAIMTAGTFGAGNTGAWGITGSGMTVSTHQANCGLGGSVTVSGVTYPIENFSQSMSVDNSGTLRYITEATPVAGYNRATALVCLTVGTGTLGGSGLLDIVRMNGSVSGAVIAQISTAVKCGGTLGINLETIAAGTSNTSCVTITTGNTYWLSLNWDGVAQTASLSIYDNTFAQVGSTLTANSATNVAAATIASVDYGNRESGTTTGSNIFENMMGVWSGGSPTTLGPKNTTQTSPIYMVSKVFNTTALPGGATTTVSPAINLPAGLTNVVWNSYENAAGTTSGCTDTAGNTYTQVTTVNLATQGHGEIWTAKNTIANPANIVTCTHTSSTFRNIIVIATAGASLTAPVDVSAVGTAAAGNANVTTGPFTPTTSTGSVVACGYITAGQVLTPGTNYYMINGNSTTSVGCELRPNAPNSSQTATLIQANTSSKWMIAVALKQ